MASIPEIFEAPWYVYLTDIPVSHVKIAPTTAEDHLREAVRLLEEEMRRDPERGLDDPREAGYVRHLATEQLIHLLEQRRQEVE